jgi:hypothetical protein
VDICQQLDDFRKEGERMKKECNENNSDFG